MSNDLAEKQMTCLLTWLLLSSWAWQLSPFGLSSFQLTTCLAALVTWLWASCVKILAPPLLIFW